MWVGINVMLYRCLITGRDIEVLQSLGSRCSESVAPASPGELGVLLAGFCLKAVQLSSIWTRT